MHIQTHDSVEAMGRAAAEQAAFALCEAVADRDEATLVVATGTSQLTVLDALVGAVEVPWSRIHGFHLDEYVGLPMSHGASFRRYLKERLVDRVPIGSFTYLDGEKDAEAAAQDAGATLSQRPIDVLLCGIGENGHLAFNDPPADFETTRPYLVVPLDAACRRQQVGEGWFSTLDEVPTHAISMSIRQILSARKIVCSVPDTRKAAAVRAAVQGEISPTVPASILRTHADVTLHLDRPAASLLKDAG